MEHYTIPNTDLRVSRIAYGTWHLGGAWDKEPLSAAAKQAADRMIGAAVDAGINHIDLADIYTFGKSDAAVGHVLRGNPGLRDRLVLQGKCGIVLAGDPDFGPPHRFDFSYAHIVGAVEGTLRRLGTDRLDLLALHRPDPLVEYEELARAFDHLHESGKVRHFGVSNHSATQIALLQKHLRQPIVLNQLELNLLHHHLISEGVLVNMRGYEYANASGLIDFCRLHGILVQAWSPLARGRLFARGADATAQERATAAKIAEIAAAHRATPEAVALAWLLRHPAGIQPILGTLSTEHLRNCIPADTLALSRVEWYALLEAARGEAAP